MVTKLILLLFYTFHVHGQVSVPAGLRPAKAVGDPVQAIVPERQPKANESAAMKMPQNLLLRSRMIAALNITPADSPTMTSSTRTVKKSPTTTSMKANEAIISETEPPIIFNRNSKKTNTVPSTTSRKAHPKSLIRPKTFGTNNYGLNTVLQTNLVDSKGRIVKGANTVPIRIPVNKGSRSPRIRHTAREVESDGEKIIPIKFGSAT